MICTWSSWCHCHPIIFWFIKIQTGLTFLVPSHPGCPGKEAVKGCLTVNIINITIITSIKQHGISVRHGTWLICAVNAGMVVICARRLKWAATNACSWHLYWRANSAFNANLCQQQLKSFLMLSYYVCSYWFTAKWPLFSQCPLVCLFVCAEFFSAVFDPISIKLGHVLYVWVSLCPLEYRGCATPGGWVTP